jgi:hypothetical protein
MAKETKTIGAKLVFAWIFSVLFIVGGIGMLFSSPISGILTLIAGVIILPPFSKMLEEKANLKITTWLKVIIVLVLLMIAGMALSGEDKVDYDQGDNIVDDSDSQAAQDTTPTQTTPSTPAVEETTTDTATIGEKNALSQALSYLRAMPFSYNGLIEQLEYEGYSHEEAVYGADNCGADWNEQAALKAQSYLDSMPFSREGLIEQLEYEGFTRAQAEYGVEAVGY